ncbi:hypothetical protein JXI42_14655 [bacterium]|nr:hypothetical protein [bacterium]
MKIKKINIHIALFLLLCLSSYLQAMRYSGDIFLFDIDSRISAMGGSWAAQNSKSGATYYNPGSLGLIEKKSIMLTHTHAFGGLVKYDFLGFCMPLKSKTALGISLMYVGGDGIPITALPDPSDTISINNRPYLVKDEDHLQLTMFPSFNYKLLDNLFIGATVKLYYAKIIENSAWGIGSNVGAVWKALPSLNLGISISDITTTRIMWDTDTKETVLPNPRIGITYDKHFPKLKGNIVASADAHYYTEENDQFIGVGLEYSYKDLLFIRVGLKNDITGDGNINTFVTGGGLKIKNWNISANFEDHSELDNSYKISASVDL